MKHLDRFAVGFLMLTLLTAFCVFVWFFSSMGAWYVFALIGLFILAYGLGVIWERID